MPRPTWRISFDYPYSFAVEPGYARATHAHDFRRERGAMVNTWQDPNTGLLGLAPSFLTEYFYRSDWWRPLTQWRTETDRWQQVYRALPWRNPSNPGADPGVLSVQTANFWSSVDNGTIGDGDIINSLNNIAIVAATTVSAYSADVIKWTAESLFTLARDEGWVWSYHVHGDEMHRPKNWMYWQFGHIGIHFSYDGTCRAYIYENGLENQPRLVDEWEMCSPGDIIGKSGYIVMIPIPGYGLSMYHSHSAQRIDSQYSSATAGAVRGHLVRLTPLLDENLLPYVYDSAKMYLGLGAVVGKVHYTFGMHVIRYPNSGSYMGEVWDPGYVPSSAPEVHAEFAPAAPGTGNVNRYPLTGGALAYDRDGAIPWDTPTNAQSQGRQGRIKALLNTTDNRYTPWLLGTNLLFRPVVLARDTTPVEPWKVERLEWTEDEQARIEGVATCLHKREAEITIAERGDTTWLIERSDDNGGTWVTQGGGLAQLADDVEVISDNGGMYHKATWKLGGMESRFDEIHQQADTAFDQVNIADAVNVMLMVSGYGPIPLNALPPELVALVLPKTPEGQNWRFGTREGDGGDDIMQSLLLFGRREDREWRLRYRWDLQAWRIEERPRDFLDPDGLFVLTPYLDEVNKAANRYIIGEGTHCFSYKAFPPEANLVQPVGLTSPDNKGARIMGQPMVNIDSLYDPQSPDYLGRVVPVKPIFTSLSDRLEIARMGARVFHAVANRRIKATARMWDYVDGMAPNKRVRVRGEVDEVRRYMFGTLPDNCLWIKRRTVCIDYLQAGEMAPEITLALDSQWQGDITK